jgi:LysR family carnitine catabolism transcriptional activator
MLRQRFTLQLGRVSVAAIPAFAGNLLPQSLKVFRQRYPKVNVTVHDVINEQVLELVRHRRVELGIGFEPDNCDGLNFHPLYLDRFVAVVPADSPLALQRQVTWTQLLAEDFIALQRPSAVRLLLEQNVAALHGKLAVAFESHQLSTIGRMVASGLGVSAVPALCINQMQELGAHCVTLVDPAVERRIGVIALSEHKLSTAAQALLDVLLSHTHAPEVTCVT